MVAAWGRHADRRGTHPLSRCVETSSHTRPHAALPPISKGREHWAPRSLGRERSWRVPAHHLAPALHQRGAQPPNSVQTCGLSWVGLRVEVPVGGREHPSPLRLTGSRPRPAAVEGCGPRAARGTAFRALCSRASMGHIPPIPHHELIEQSQRKGGTPRGRVPLSAGGG